MKQSTRKIFPSSSYATSSLNSPFSIISWTTSRPPTNSPLTISCGNVGQSLYRFKPGYRRMSGTEKRHGGGSTIPERTPSSDRMSNEENFTSWSLRSPTIFLEKPHRGSTGVPFMKSMILSFSMSAFRRAFSVCSSSTLFACAMGLERLARNFGV